MDSRAGASAGDIRPHILDDAALAWYAKLLSSATRGADAGPAGTGSTEADRGAMSALQDVHEDAEMRSLSGEEPMEGPGPVNDLAFRGKGPWTPEEDKELLSFVEKYGARHWRKVPKVTRLRRDAQSCRLRWTSYLSPHVSKLPFTPEEDKLLLESVSWSGETKWATIAAQKFPKRTGYQIQRRWHVLINHQRKAREEAGGVAVGGPSAATLSQMANAAMAASEAGHSDAQGASVFAPGMSFGERPASASGRPGHRRQGGLHLSDPGGQEGLSNGFPEQSPERPGHRRRGALAGIPAEKSKDMDDCLDEDDEGEDEQPIRSMMQHRGDVSKPSRLGRNLAKAASEDSERVNEEESALVRRTQTVNQQKNPFLMGSRDPYKSPESGTTSSAPVSRPMSSSGRVKQLIPAKSPEAESELRRSQSTKRPNSLTGAEFGGSPEEDLLRKAHTAKRRSPFADSLATEGEMDPRRRHSTSDFKFLTPHRELLPGFMPSPAELMLLSNAHLGGSALGGNKTPDSDIGDLRSPLSSASLRSPTSDLSGHEFSTQQGLQAFTAGRGVPGQGQGHGHATISEASLSELQAMLVQRLVMGLEEQALQAPRKEHSGSGSLLEQALHQQALQQKVAELLQTQSQSQGLCATHSASILEQLAQGRALPPLPQSVEGVRRSEGGSRTGKQSGAAASSHSASFPEQAMLENLQHSGIMGLIKQAKLGVNLPASASVPGPDLDDGKRGPLPASASLPGASASGSRTGHRRSGGGRLEVELHSSSLGDPMEGTPVNPLSLLGGVPAAEKGKESGRGGAHLSGISPTPSAQDDNINLDLCLGGSALEVTRKQLGRSSLGNSRSPGSPRSSVQAGGVRMIDNNEDRSGSAAQGMNTVALLSLVSEYDAAVDRLAAESKMQFRNRLMSAAGVESRRELEESDAMDHEGAGSKRSSVCVASIDLQSMLDEFRTKLRTLQ